MSPCIIAVLTPVGNACADWDCLCKRQVCVSQRSGCRHRCAAPSGQYFEYLFQHLLWLDSPVFYCLNIGRFPIHGASCANLWWSWSRRGLGRIEARWATLLRTWKCLQPCTHVLAPAHRSVRTSMCAPHLWESQDTHACMRQSKAPEG